MTNDERYALARLFAVESVVPDMCAEFQLLSREDKLTVLLLATHIIQYERRRRGTPEQRKAMRLLRTWLTPEQRGELQRRRYFSVTGSAGGRYRIMPGSGVTAKLERHGAREFGHACSYCLHDELGELPKADVALAHLLLLTTDEPRFLSLANHHDRANMMWNGEWLRRLNARRRREREEAAA